MYVRDRKTTTDDAKRKKMDEEEKNREREREKRERKCSFALVVRRLRTDISFMIRRVHTPRKPRLFCMNLRHYAE